MLKERVLAPLIAVALVVGLIAVAWARRSHKRNGPLMLSLAGSAGVACGRLIWDVPLLVYGSGALLLGASVWNLWLKRPRPQPQSLVPLRLNRKPGGAA